MLKASALYLTLVIVLIITALLGSMIYIHSFYRAEQQKIDRKIFLDRQMQACISLSTSSFFPYTDRDSLMPSPISSWDSVYIGKYKWGFFDRITVRCAQQQDTLKTSFILGQISNDSTVLYIIEEDRPLSISGKTKIQGTAFLPKAGIRPAFVDGEYYQGPEKMVAGNIRVSQEDMPLHTVDYIERIQQTYQEIATSNTYPHTEQAATVRTSFYDPTLYYQLPSEGIIQGTDSLIGNIIVYSDSLIRISKGSYLKDIIIMAPYIRIEDYFSGSAQFFAFDSLRIGNHVQLQYPSVAAVISNIQTGHSVSLSLGEASQVQGTVMLYNPEKKEQPDLLDIGKNVKISGEVISFGLLKYTDSIHIVGSLHAYRLITQRPSSLYENYLIDITMERNKRSSHFLLPRFWIREEDSSLLLPVKWTDY